MRFKVTLKNQLTGETVEREISSSYDATSVVEREARQTMKLPDAWDAIKSVRIEDVPEHGKALRGPGYVIDSEGRTRNPYTGDELEL